MGLFKKRNCFGFLMEGKLSKLADDIANKYNEKNHGQKIILYGDRISKEDKGVIAQMISEQVSAKVTISKERLSFMENNKKFPVDLDYFLNSNNSPHSTS